MVSHWLSLQPPQAVPSLGKPIELKQVRKVTHWGARAPKSRLRRSHRGARAGCVPCLSEATDGATRRTDYRSVPGDGAQRQQDPCVRATPSLSGSMSPC